MEDMHKEVFILVGEFGKILPKCDLKLGKMSTQCLLIFDYTTA